MEEETILKGKAWVCGDYTDSYQILPERYWNSAEKLASLDPADLGQHAMAGADPNFAADARNGKYAFIIAGRNFGGGGKVSNIPFLPSRAPG